MNAKHTAATVLPTVLKSVLMPRLWVLSAVKTSCLFIMFFVGAFTSAQQLQTPVYISQELPVVGLDAVHVSPAASFVRFRESNLSTTSTPAAVHTQQQEPLVFIPRGTMIANADLLVLTSAFILEQQADLQKVTNHYSFKSLDATPSGTAQAPQVLSTSPFGTPHGGVYAFLKIATACSVTHSFKISPTAIATHRQATHTFGHAAQHVAPIVAAVPHQRSPLEKHHRYFNLPPPARA